MMHSCSVQHTGASRVSFITQMYNKILYTENTIYNIKLYFWVFKIITKLKEHIITKQIEN